MLLDFKYDVEVAFRAAVGAGFALAGNTQARAGIDAWWNAQFNGFLALDAALSVALGAALLHDLACALARRARPGDGKESLLIGQLAAPAAGGTGNHAGALLRAGAVAGFAEFLAGQFDLRGHASRGFLKGERHVVTQVCAALGPRSEERRVGKECRSRRPS